MLTVSLTSIPPRFPGLGQCLEGLLAQNSVSRVVLSLPHSYTRFPDSFTVPKLPDGVQLLRCDDVGPACKILPLASQSEANAPILYCDDDWDYAEGWAKGFLTAHHAHPNKAIAASSFSAARIGASRQSGVVAQGFAGVLVTPQMFPAPAYDIPASFSDVDDIWLSGMLALNSIEIKTVSHLRKHASPSRNEAMPLQTGPSRAIKNRDCVIYMRGRFGIWPEQSNGA